MFHVACFVNEKALVTFAIFETPRRLIRFLELTAQQAAMFAIVRMPDGEFPV